MVRLIKKATDVSKVGHGGTLDPFAEGVLLIGIGRSATKRLGEFLNCDKEYLAEVVIGIVTDTYDSTGRVLKNNADFNSNPENRGEKLEERIRETLRLFEGEISQLPPLFSAIKVDGVRSYKAARRGIELKLKARQVIIKHIEFTRLTETGFEMRVACSHGTYIRSLAYDIGNELGMGAHLGRLIRTRVGSYTLDQAVDLENFIHKTPPLRSIATDAGWEANADLQWR